MSAGKQDKDDLETINMDNLTGGETSSQKNTKYIAKCCRGQKCSDITPNCAAVSVNGATNVMVLDNNKSTNTISGTDHRACCKFKTCTQLGWNNAKCKDRNFTRAAYRGGLKNGNAEGRPPTNNDNAVALYGYQNLGDKYCCEHKPKTSSGGSYARQCVGKEYHKGTYKRKSPGVATARFMGPKLNTGTLTVANADACKTACNQNNSCTNFTMNRNGTCELFAGGATGGADALSKHGGPPLRGIVGIELGGGASTAAGRTRVTHYVTKNTFQNWSNGGSSLGNTSIGTNPFYTGKPHQNQIRIGKGMSTDDINAKRVNQLTTTQDAGNCSPHTGYTSRHNCEDTTWKGRRDVCSLGLMKILSL